MNQDEFNSIRKTAIAHTERIQEAYNDLKKLFPLDITKVQNFDKAAIYSIEMLTSRFSKLQDYLGSTVFDLFFEIEGENTTTWTMIDKINHLEKFGIIDDAHIWRDMRKSRNFLTHEYPDQPEIIAASLNIIYKFVPILLDINNKLFTKMAKDIS